MSASSAKKVSFDDEPLIVVDEDNNVLGYQPKADVHAGDGILHRAFSVFLFDDEGRVLIQKRAASKPLWPGFWANACCSHPRRGETEAEAAVRRITEELGIEAAPPAPSATERRARMARMRGEPEPRVDEQGAELPPSRGTDLPDIEEIKTSLRPNPDAKAARVSRPLDPEEVAEQRRGFRLGFTVMVTAAVVLVCLYIYAPLIIQQMPASEPAMIAYVDWANGARDGIDRILARSANGLNVLLERIGVES